MQNAIIKDFSQNVKYMMNSRKLIWFVLIICGLRLGGERSEKHQKSKLQKNIQNASLILNTMEWTS